MEIRIRYDNRTTTMEIPEEEFETMIRLDYEDRLAKADDAETVRKRTPQEILDERFNKPDYNNWHRLWRHTDNRLAEDLRDTAWETAQDLRESHEDTCAFIRGALRPEAAEMVIAIHAEGIGGRC